MLVELVIEAMAESWRVNDPRRFDPAFLEGLRTAVRRGKVSNPNAQRFLKSPSNPVRRGTGVDRRA